MSQYEVQGDQRLFLAPPVSSGLSWLLLASAGTSWVSPGLSRIVTRLSNLASRASCRWDLARQ